MQEIRGEKDFEKHMLANFDNPKVLIFASKGVKTSIDFLEALDEAKDELDSEIKFFVIKEEVPENQQLFFRYKINTAPSTVVLNADMTALHTLGNISPADVLIKIEESLKILQTNKDLESSRLDKLFKKKFSGNKFVLCKFASSLTKVDLEQVQGYLHSNHQPYVELTEDEIKEEFLFVALAHLSHYLTTSFEGFSERIPLAVFNNNVFYNQEELVNFCESNKQTLEQIRENEEKRIETLEAKTPILLFTNSDPNLPSEQKELQDRLMTTLKGNKVLYSYIDVYQQSFLQKRLAEKTCTDNVVYPVLKNHDGSYINSQNIKILLADGLDKLIDSKFIIHSVDDRIKYLLSSDKVVMLIKGTPDAPQCGFSKRIVEFMNSKGIKYSYYNILADVELRERLKVYSNWKTYPQVYVDTELVGGNDVIAELEANGQFDEVFGITK